MALAQSLGLGNPSLQLPGPGKAPLFLTPVRLWVNSATLLSVPRPLGRSLEWRPASLHSPVIQLPQPASGGGGSDGAAHTRKTCASGWGLQPSVSQRSGAGQTEGTAKGQAGCPWLRATPCPGQDLASPWLQSVSPAGAPRTFLGPSCPCSSRSQPRSWAASLSRPWTQGRP